MHNDETGAYVNGKIKWVHVICDKSMTYYYISDKRGRKAMNEIGFLPDYHGIVVHDFLSSYFCFTNAQHAACGAHLLRELTGIYENHPEQKWAKEMYDLLLAMCRAADFYNQNPDLESRGHYMGCLKASYDEIVEKAVLQNPPPERVPGKRGRPGQGKIRALINRFKNFKEEILRFLDNALVPFTNNQAERDLRMVKMKNKVIGCFRSMEGARNFLAIKSFTSTAAKRGVTAFQAIFDLLCGNTAFETE